MQQIGVVFALVGGRVPLGVYSLQFGHIPIGHRLFDVGIGGKPFWFRLLHWRRYQRRIEDYSRLLSALSDTLEDGVDRHLRQVLELAVRRAIDLGKHGIRDISRGIAAQIDDSPAFALEEETHWRPTELGECLLLVR